MKAIILSLMVCVLAGCLDEKSPIAFPASTPLQPAYRRVESARVPVELRQQNWADRKGDGSCSHASTLPMLRWQGFPKVAATWRRRYSGPESLGNVQRKLEAFGIACLVERQGDRKFLEWVSRTRRLAVIHHLYDHTTTFSGFRGAHAIIIDSRWPAQEVKVPIQTFLRSWRYYGGNAITLVAPPPPPQPWR